MEAKAELEFSSSVLETEKTLVLAEKGSKDDEVELLTAGDKFRILATMNPGGDFGKKEVITVPCVTFAMAVTMLGDGVIEADKAYPRFKQIKCESGCVVDNFAGPKGLVFAPSNCNGPHDG